MKKLFTFLILSFTATIMLRAQVPADVATKQHEKLQALYVAFITQKLDLTASEAQNFWPVHNQFEKEVKAVDINLPELDREQQILDIKKRYQPQFIKVLSSPQRVDKLFKLNAEFRKKLIERIRKKNGML